MEDVEMKIRKTLTYVYGTTLAACFAVACPQHVMAEDMLFGYFANNGTAHQNSDHTNIMHIWSGTWPDLNQAESIILQELSAAQSQGIGAIVSLSSFLFDWDQPASGPTGLGHCPFTDEPNASQQLSDLVSSLVNSGFLVPNNPDASVVKAFLIVDEPELCGLTDTGSSPHPVLASAVDIVHSHPDTQVFPTMINASESWANAIGGLRLVDWVGMFDYGNSTGGYLNNFSNFQNALLSSQKAILKPQASLGGFMSSWGSYHNPDPVMDFLIENAQTTGLIPFFWSHEEADGVYDIPNLKQDYANFGNQIISGDPILLVGGCIKTGYNEYGCSVSPSGGDSPYSYQWGGDCGGTTQAIQCTIQCNGAPGVPDGVATLTVTDDRGYYRTDSHDLFCGQVQ